MFAESLINWGAGGIGFLINAIVSDEILQPRLSVFITYNLPESVKLNAVKMPLGL